MNTATLRKSAANVIQELGPFPGVEAIHGVTWDGRHVWFGSGDKLNALEPDTGKIDRTLDVPAHAGTAFDGRHLFQIAERRINKVDPQSGKIVASIPAPGDGKDSGMAWSEGSLWVGVYADRKIHQVDPADGRVLRTLESDRFVTGVTWVDGGLWHGTWENDKGELRHIDADTGEVIEQLDMPATMGVSGLESDGGDRFFCGGGKSGKLRVVRKG
ncbi:PQQ-binding-like beta-propeller repeat protein [soil metagenome]